MNVRDVQLETHKGGFVGAETTFEVRVFFEFRKAPVSLYLSTYQDVRDLTGKVLEFAKELLFLSAG